MIRSFSRFLKLLLIATLSFLIVSACQTQAPTNPVKLTGTNCKAVQHNVGETQVCDRPQKIAVLGPHMLDILLSLGGQPAGYAEFSTEDIGNPVKEIPILGSRVKTQPISLGLRNSPSLEALLKLKPDLILGEKFLKQFYSNLSQIAPTLLFSGDEDNWKEGIVGVAKAVGREEKARETIASHERKIGDLRTQLAPVVAKYPRLLIVDATQLPGILNLRGDRSFAGIMLKQLGFELVSPENQKAEFAEAQLAFELLPQLDADIIVAIVSDHMRDDAFQHIQQVWRTNPLTQSLRATKEGRVYFVDYYIWGSNIRGPIAADILLNEAKKFLSPLKASLTNRRAESRRT